MTTQFFIQTRSLLTLRGGFVNNLAEARRINQDCSKQTKTHDHIQLILCYLQLLRLGFFVLQHNLLFRLTHGVSARTENDILIFDLLPLSEYICIIWIAKESAGQCRGHGFDSWSGKTPHAGRNISLCTATTEPVP